MEEAADVNFRHDGVVISLGIDHGDKIVLTTDAQDGEAVLDDLAEILATDHDA